MADDRWIPVSMPSLAGNEESYVLDAVRSTWISSTGTYVDRFEGEFAIVAGTRAAVSVVNGTAALHVTLAALGVGPGDEVIVPALTYVATANTVRYTGATPVFVDVDPETWCIDSDAVAEAVTSRTAGVIAVHLYGHPADMDPLMALASRNGLWVIEDAAEAHGARYKGRVAGSLGTAAAFSFYGNKILTSGEGGAVSVADPHLEARIRLLRGQGMDPERRYWFPEVGYNYRMTNVAAAIACAQLERMNDIVEARQDVFDGYRDRLASIPGIQFQPIAEWAEPAPWLFSILVDEGSCGVTRDELASRLAVDGVDTRPFFYPLHRLPRYVSNTTPTLKHTERLAAQGMNLPTFVGLTDDDLDRISGFDPRCDWACYVSPTRRNLFVVGIGGLAHEMAQLAAQVDPHSERWELKGFIAPAFDRAANMGLQVAGDDDWMLSSTLRADIIIGIGEPLARSAVASRYRAQSGRLAFPNLIHPSAVLDLNTVSMGQGNVITAGCIATVDIQIGDFNLLNWNTTVGHGAAIGSNSVINPAASISGDVTLGDDVLVGTGARILEGRSVGTGARVGAGAVVTRDVAAGTTVVGVPAHPLG